MKKVLAVLAACALAVPALAQVTVYSNIAGYVSVDIPAGFSLLSVPLETNEGVHTLDSLFGDQLPEDTEVYFFDMVEGYTTYTYYGSEDGWFDDEFNPVGATALDRGTGFWVATSQSVTVSLLGTVSTEMQEVSLPQGFSLVGFGFPVDLELDDIEGLTPADGDEIYVFQPGVGYVTYTYYDGAGWFDDEFNPPAFKFEPGVAAWYARVGAGTTWEQELPENIDL